MHRILLAAIAATLLGGPAAGAEVIPVSQISAGDMQRAVAIAEAHWPANPCTGLTTVTLVDEATATTLTGVSHRPAGYAYIGSGLVGDCRVYLVACDDLTLAWVCTVLAHELGHVLGHAHTDEPNDLMAPMAPMSSACASALAEPARPTRTTRTTRNPNRRPPIDAPSARRLRAPQPRPAAPAVPAAPLTPPRQETPMQTTETPSIETFVKPDTHSRRLDRREKRDRLDRRRARDERARSRRGTRAWRDELYESAFTAAG